MLREMRKGVRGVLSWAIVLTVVAGFVFWGVADYFGGGKGRSIAAKVNGQKIPWATVDLLYSRLQNQLGENAETKMVKQDIRRLLIQRIALIQSISKLGFQVNDEQVAQTILQIPAFQVEGRFSKDRFQEVLRQNALSEANIRTELKEEILLRQLEQGLAQSSFSLESELKVLIGLLEQKRDVGYVIIPAQKYQAEIKVDPKDLQAYFDEHQSDFILPEQVSLSYVELSLEDLAKAIQLEEPVLKKHYEEHIAAYTAPERVRARHILIPLSDKGDATLSETEAKEKAQKLLARVKGGESFAKLARTESSDKGSAEKGGDLGWFTRGQMVPPFEEAAFTLKKPNQVSEPIRSQFGYHLIQLIEHKPTEVRSYAEVKELVKEQLSQEEARKIFGDRTEMMAKLAFENSTSLEPIAGELGLKIRATELFSRLGGGTGLANNSDLIQAAFSDSVLKQSNNSELVKINDTSVIICRIKEHKPAKQQTLAEVESQVKAKLTTERAQAKAKEIGQGFVARLQKGEDPKKVAAESQLAWINKAALTRRAQDIDPTLLATAFRVARGEPGKIAVKGNPMPSGDFLVLTLNRVESGNIAKMDEKTQQVYNQSLIDVVSQMEYALYANQVMTQAKVDLYTE